MLKKLCSYPGCHKVVEAGVKYCDRHKNTDREKYREYKRKRMENEEEARRQQFYNSKAWEGFRANQEAAQLGVDIFEYYTTGIVITAEQYHHIEEVTEAWHRRLDRDNVIGLSEANHRRIHKEYAANALRYATALPARVRRQRGDIKTFYFFLKVPSSS